METAGNPIRQNSGVTVVRNDKFFANVHIIIVKNGGSDGADEKIFNLFNKG